MPPPCLNCEVRCFKARRGEDISERRGSLEEEARSSVCVRYPGWSCHDLESRVTRNEMGRSGGCSATRGEGYGMVTTVRCVVPRWRLGASHWSRGGVEI